MMIFNQPDPRLRLGPDRTPPQHGLGTPVPQHPITPPRTGQPVIPVHFFRRMPGGGTVFVKPGQAEVRTVELPDL